MSAVEVTSTLFRKKVLKPDSVHAFEKLACVVGGHDDAPRSHQRELRDHRIVQPRHQRVLNSVRWSQAHPRVAHQRGLGNGDHLAVGRGLADRPGAKTDTHTKKDHTQQDQQSTGHLLW